MKAHACASYTEASASKNQTLLFVQTINNWNRRFIANLPYQLPNPTTIKNIPEHTRLMTSSGIEPCSIELSLLLTIYSIKQWQSPFAAGNRILLLRYRFSQHLSLLRQYTRTGKKAGYFLLRYYSPSCPVHAF